MNLYSNVFWKWNHVTLPLCDANLCSVQSTSVLLCWLIFFFMGSIRSLTSSFRTMNTLSLLLLALSLTCTFFCFFNILLDTLVSFGNICKILVALVCIFFSFFLFSLFRSESGVHSFQSSGEKAWGGSESVLQRIWVHIYLLWYELDQTNWRKRIWMDGDCMG